LSQTRKGHLSLIAKTQPLAQTTVKTKVTTRALSRAFLLANGDSDSGEKLVTELENDTFFQWLIQAGIVRRLQAHAAIPITARATYQLTEAVSFVREHDLEKKSGWTQVLNATNISSSKIREYAIQWGVNAKKLENAVRAIHGTLQIKGPSSEYSLENIEDRTIASQESESSIPATTFSTDILQTLEEFVSRYKVSQQAFTDYILGGDANLVRLMSRFGCTTEDAQKIINAIAVMEVHSSPTAPSSALLSDENDYDDLHLPAGVRGNIERFTVVRVVARLSSEKDNEQSLKITFYPNTLTPRYRLDPTRFSTLLQSSNTAGIPDNTTLHLIAEKIEAINERTGTLIKMVHRLCSRQSAFLLSGDLADICPYSQGSLARECNISASTVSRVTHGVGIDTPTGRVALSMLMPPLKSIVLSLNRLFPSWSDEKIAIFLKNRFDVTVSRRTISYHRGAYRQTK
jgi:hypothetical protein